MSCARHETHSTSFSVFRKMDDDEASAGLIGKDRVIEGIKGPGQEKKY